MSSSYFIKVFGQSFFEQDLKTQTGFLFQLKKDKMILLRNPSSWICSTVMLASSGIALPRDQVKAHKVRAIVYPWSIFNSASLTEILLARYSRSDNTFYYHYLRSMPQHTIVQKVIFPPIS
jgi:hypothetical protein